MSLNDIFFSDFINKIEEKEKERKILDKDKQMIVQKKYESIVPVKDFLNKFRDIETKVKNSQCYDLTARTHTLEPELFDYKEDESSDAFSPGISIFILHPAEMEIAVNLDITKKGLYTVDVSTPHPMDYLLTQSKFYDCESLCSALAKFLRESTISYNKEKMIELMSRKSLSSYVKEKSSD